MINTNSRITYFAETDYRNTRTKFGIKAIDRTKHMYVIGKSGMGKSTLLENMAIQDIENGEGLAILDPHGSFAEKMLDYIPEHRIKDVIYFAPFDVEYPVSFNVMEDVGIDKRHLVASGLMSAFKKIWVDAWSARMEYILNNILLALLAYPDSTLLGVNRMLADKDYRKQVVDHLTDPSVKSFWVEEFAKYNERYMQEAGAAIQNKVGQFTANPIIRNIVGQSKSSFDIREVMDNRKIFIANLSKGRIGEQNANLLGGMLLTKIYLGAMSRAEVRERDMAELPNFYLYVDEFQSFANESFADILSEARKYKLNLLIAHQYIEQMPDEVRAAVFGNVGTMVIFRVGSYDAEIFEKEYAPNFTRDDIVNLGKTQIYLRLMIDSVGSKPFSAVTLAPFPRPEISYREDIIKYSREHNAHGRETVEGDIQSWHAPIERPRSTGFAKADESGGAKDKAPTSYDRPGVPSRAPYVNKPAFREAPRAPEPLNQPVAQDTGEKPPATNFSSKIRDAVKAYTPTSPASAPQRAPVSPPQTPYNNRPPVVSRVHGPSPLLKDALRSITESKSEHREPVLPKKDIPVAPLPERTVLPPRVASPLPKANPTKDPSAEKVFALKAALEKAGLGTKTPHIEKPAVAKVESPVAPNPQIPNNTEKVVEKTETVSPSTSTREVPEDILKKILE